MIATSLVIAAAGNGSRFGGPIPKQLLPLAGRAVLLRSLDAFVGLVDEAVLAVSAELREHITALIAGHPLQIRLVVGGTTRQESVFAGVRAAHGAVVLVHDAVRPLVPRACISACLNALRTHPAAVVAIPCAHTVKRARDGVVETTVPRADLWLAQTPQGFQRDLGLAAFARAAVEGWTCSDDAQVMERAGHVVAIVPGDAANLKLTTPDDLALAHALWSLRTGPSLR